MNFKWLGEETYCIVNSSQSSTRATATGLLPALYQGAAYSAVPNWHLECVQIGGTIPTYTCWDCLMGLRRTNQATFSEDINHHSLGIQMTYRERAAHAQSCFSLVIVS